LNLTLGRTKSRQHQKEIRPPKNKSPQIFSSAKLKLFGSDAAKWLTSSDEIHGDRLFGHCGKFADRPPDSSDRGVMMRFLQKPAGVARIETTRRHDFHFGTGVFHKFVLKLQV